jgi:hypothetical protein
MAASLPAIDTGAVDSEEPGFLLAKQELVELSQELHRVLLTPRMQGALARELPKLQPAGPAQLRELRDKITQAQLAPTEQGNQRYALIFGPQLRPESILVPPERHRMTNIKKLLL